MEDPDQGAQAPKKRVSGGARRKKKAGAPPVGNADGRIAPARDGHDAPQGREKPKKRRRRRRGRKAFVQDKRPANENAQQDVAKSEKNQSRKDNTGKANSAGAAPRAQHGRGAGFSLNGRHKPFSDSAATRHITTKTEHFPVYAALDLGTNNCRLLVAVPTKPGQFRVVDAFSRIVRLGEGLSSSGRLGQAAMDRAVEALKVCSDKLHARQVKRARLIATEACRSAENGAEFIQRVQEEAGLSLEIIDRKTEARLAVSGCGSLVERGTEGVVLFDIGGGSSEIALIDISRSRTPRLANHIVSWTSLPVGVVSLAERFGGRHVTRQTFDAMVSEVSGMLDRFDGRTKLSHLMKGEQFHLLGTSGTVTTLAGVHLGLEKYDRRRVDGLWMQSRQVDAMIEKLLGWDFDQRVANACIGADRADLVLAGCAILEAIRQHWPSERLRVADRGLREGMLSELMADDGAWRSAKGRRTMVR